MSVTPPPGLFGTQITPAAAVGALGLGYDVLKNQGNLNLSSMGSIATQQAAMGQVNQGYLQSGQLPPGVQQGITAQLGANQAAIKAQYANLGMSGSTMETQALQGAQQAATQEHLNLAMGLLKTGIGQTGLSADLYSSIVKLQGDENKGMMDAVSNFAAALAGGAS